MARIQESSDVSVATEEPLTIPVDYNDVGAVDPPVGATFGTQADVTAALGGATNFKHLQLAWDALPPVVNFAPTFNLAAGVHRPIGAEADNFSWDLTGKTFIGVSAFLDGAAPSAWVALPGLGGLAVQSFSTGTNPEITFAGTPFTGLDLKGRFLVADTGQVLICHDNNASQLFVLTNPAPSPVSITVTSSPATILRNSLTDAIGSALNRTTVRVGGNVSLNNLTVDHFDRNNGTGVEFRGPYLSGVPALNNVMIDFASYFEITGQTSRAQNGIVHIGGGFSEFVTWAGVIFRPPPEVNDGVNFVMQILHGTVFAFTGPGMYFRGSKIGAIFNDASFSALHQVWDEIGQASIASINGALLAATGPSGFLAGPVFSDFGGGKTSELRNFASLTPATTSCLMFDGIKYSNNVGVVVASNNALDIVKVRNGASVGAGSWLDGGGNTGTGFHAEGPRATLELEAGVTLTGTAGDVRLPDGTIETFANIVANGPLVFLDDFSLVSKA